jgi:hypothetical protein
MKSGKRKKRRAANRFSKVAGELQMTADKNFKIQQQHTGQVNNFLYSYCLMAS